MFHPELGPQQDSHKLTMTKVVEIAFPPTHFVILATEISCNETADVPQTVQPLQPHTGLFQKKAKRSIDHTIQIISVARSDPAPEYECAIRFSHVSVSRQAFARGSTNRQRPDRRRSGKKLIANRQQ